MKKLNYQTLTAVISNDVLKLIFQPELDFITQHRWLFLENQPEILFRLDGAGGNAVAGDSRVVRGGLMIQQLLAIREMKANIEKQEEEQRKMEAYNGNPQSLTGGTWRQ